jgi:hypothetical protein
MVYGGQQGWKYTASKPLLTANSGRCLHPYGWRGGCRPSGGSSARGRLRFQKKTTGVHHWKD